MITKINPEPVCDGDVYIYRERESEREKVKSHCPSAELFGCDTKAKRIQHSLHSSLNKVVQNKANYEIWFYLQNSHR